MLELIRDEPGRLFLIATLLPLLAFFVLLIAGTIRQLRGVRGTKPSAIPGYFAVAVMAMSAGCAIVGLSWFLQEAHTYANEPLTLEARWSERIDWVRIGSLKHDARPALSLELGYRIDHLSAIMVAMVTVVATLIFLFSIGYMHDERQRDNRGRRGRFGRFFLYLSLFAFAMLNLLIADNLLQIFIGWELVGVCSFFLIGFYFERTSASIAANKAFLINRIGDAGFLVALAVTWSTFGTFHIQELIEKAATLPADSSALWWIGIGLVAGCAGKSAQIPLHTWLPDAMEGPTPVSALIHAATMVAAGVYLVGRAFPLFTPDVLMVIAYMGAITMFLSATIAVVQTDIKRVLAFSTCSQLGFMMLALALGGWVAGLLHLLTHAFFKALLFLCAGSVIHGLHHEQNLSKMGGLRRKMPITAYAMLIGVLAIAGTPLLSGWYSKDRILAHVIGSAVAGHYERPLLLFLPFLTAGLTSFYMFRLWLLAFAGTPRDPHLYEHTHESPWVMTVPLVLLAAFSIAIAWGWPLWDAEASYLGQLLHAGQPHTVEAQFATAFHYAEANHLLAGGLALALAITGFAIAWSRHKAGTLLAFGGPRWLAKLLQHKYYFDELYSRIFTKPTMRTTQVIGAFDKRPTDKAESPRRFDFRTLDGVWNAIADVSAFGGAMLQRVQTGQLRQYVLALGLTVVAALGILFVRTR